MSKTPIEFVPILVTLVIVFLQVIFSKKRTERAKENNPQNSNIIYQRILQNLFNYEGEEPKREAISENPQRAENDLILKKPKQEANRKKAKNDSPVNRRLTSASEMSNDPSEYTLIQSERLNKETTLDFKEDDIVKGFIFSEIIGKPKSLTTSKP